MKPNSKNHRIGQKNINGLGHSNTVEAASLAQRIEFEDKLKELTYKYRNGLQEDIYNKLLNYNPRQV